MRLVHTESAVDGPRLAMDVYGGQSAATPLLRAGVELDDRYRRALAGAGVARVLVEDVDSEGIVVKPALPQAARTEAATRYGALLDQCRGAFARGERMPWDAVAEAEKISFLLREESLTDDDSAVVLVDTTGAAAYRVQHAIDTTVLGLRIARRLFGERGRVTGGGGRSTEGIDDALRRLALGLLLHDLGIGDATDNFFVLDGAEIDRVRGLRGGADDYVGKPFSPAELAARIEAVLRRAGEREKVRDRYDDGVVMIDFGTREVTIRGNQIHLTPLEFRLLAALTEHAGQVLSREQLLDLVWGSTYEVTDDQVKTYIGYLRRKIGDDAVDSQLIETVRGFGYRYRRQTP